MSQEGYPGKPAIGGTGGEGGRGGDGSRVGGTGGAGGAGGDIKDTSARLEAATDLLKALSEKLVITDAETAAYLKEIADKLRNDSDEIARRVTELERRLNVTSVTWAGR